MGRVKVAVSLPSLLVKCTNGESEVEIEASTIQDCLDRLLEEYPLLRVHLVDDDGKVREHVNLFYNDENLQWLEDWHAPLNPGDRLTILQAVSGG